MLSYPMGALTTSSPAKIVMSKKKVYILKIGPYDPEIQGLSKYESYDLIATCRYSPGLSNKEYVKQHVERSRIKGTEIILCSKAKRAEETAAVIKELVGRNAKIVPTLLLNEVGFSMKSLLSEEEYRKGGSDIARERFIERFVADKLLEPRNRVYKRIKNLLELLTQDPYRDKKVVCVSHSFFMKVLSIYLRNKKLFGEPSILKKYFNPKKRTFEFCEGFTFTV